jgi:enolase
MKILPLKYQVPLYKHIYDLSGKTNLTLSVPAFTVISGGKYAGKNLAVQVWCF